MKIMKAGLMTALLASAAIALPVTAHAEENRGHMTQTAAANIVETAEAAGQFQTLLAAAQAAGIAEVLQSDGPFTVFAPTDDAFAALPDGTVENLLKPENRDQLAAILTYHVVRGRVMSSELAGRQIQVETVEGSFVQIDGTSGVTVNGANVVQADIPASNGVIHVIDQVILPQ